MVCVNVCRSRYWPDWAPGALKGRHPDARSQKPGMIGGLQTKTSIMVRISLAQPHISVSTCCKSVCVWQRLRQGHNQPEPMRGQDATRRNRNDIVTVNFLPESRSEISCQRSLGKRTLACRLGLQWNRQAASIGFSKAKPVTICSASAATLSPASIPKILLIRKTRVTLWFLRFYTGFIVTTGFNEASRKNKEKQYVVQRIVLRSL